MSQKIHNISLPNDGLGDELRQAFSDVNDNTTELYNIKVDKVAGKALSDNNYNNVDKAKVDALTGLEEQNVQADWSQLDPTDDSYIKNKPIFETTAIDVSAIWISGLSFDVIANAYPVNGVSYFSDPGVVTLDASDPTLDRIDLIVAIAPIFPATSGTLGFIKGTPASPSIVSPPDFDPSLEYVIKQITVKAAATEPFATANTQIYNEGTEWTFALTANIAQTTNDPSVGVNCLEATNNLNTDRILFTAPAPLSTGSVDLLTFDFKLKEIIPGKTVFLEFLLSGVRILKFGFISGQNGYDDTNLSYQKISILKSDLNLNLQNFDQMRIRPFFASLGYFVDNVILHTGSGSETIPDTGIPEAPIDGDIYGRIDGAWQIIAASSADMLKSVYDPGLVESDAFSMTNMTEGVTNKILTATERTKLGTLDTFSNAVQAATAKTTPVDADLFGILDSAAALVVKKLSWSNVKATLKTYFDTLYSPKFGTRITNATVTGTYVLDHAAGDDFKLTMTGATVFSESNLPTGTNTLEFTIKLTGNFAPTYPAYWDVLGDTYDGTVWNFISVQIHKGDAMQEATAFISNF